jgi:hypothetical protein
MRRFASALLLILLAAWAAADEIKINNLRPSRMLGMLALSRWDAQVFEAQYEEGSLIPSGLRVKADDVRGVLIVHGDPDSIDELKRYISLFDVKKREIKLTLDIDAPLDIHHNRSETTIKNNTAWGLSDGPSGINLKVLVRINDDASITYFLTIEKDKVQRTLLVRAKNGNVVDVSVDQVLKTDQDKLAELFTVLDKKTTVGKLSPTDMTLKLRAAIVEDPVRRN